MRHDLTRKEPQIDTDTHGLLLECRPRGRSQKVHWVYRVRRVQNRVKSLDVGAIRRLCAAHGIIVIVGAYCNTPLHQKLNTSKKFGVRGQEAGVMSEE